eukprot:10450575-Prorocentrum_lima.AAC.1
MTLSYEKHWESADEKVVKVCLNQILRGFPRPFLLFRLSSAANSAEILLRYLVRGPLKPVRQRPGSFSFELR